MKTNPNATHNIAPTVFNEVTEYLKKIEKEHNVIILQAIESGSRAWGFPSPDSDYDVRFIYANPSDWYLQLFEEKDVIEIPISDELDIGGWDLRKALKLANKGNAVIQEWMISPIVYKQSDHYSRLYNLLSKAFNPTTAYYHYRSMAKKAYLELADSETKKLKRFFYFARATLSAKWIFTHQTMPSIEFAALFNNLIKDRAMVEKIEHLVNQKGKESEKSVLQVPTEVYLLFVTLFEELDEDISFNSDDTVLITNDDFRSFLADK
jgi:predicted nucleotidyltransferase